MAQRGRKGYEFEKQDLERMRMLIRSDFTILENIQKGEITEKRLKQLEATKARILKYLDKLHANKLHTDMTSDGKPLPTPLLYVLHNDSDQKDFQSRQTDTGSPGGDERGEDHRDTGSAN